MKKRHDRKYRNRRNKSVITGHPLNSVNLASLASAARAEQDETVKGLLRAVHYTQDPELAQDAAEYLGGLAVEYALEPHPFAPPIDPEEAHGEIELGLVRNKYSQQISFGLRLKEMVRNVLLIGLIGSGKTTAIIKILSGLMSFMAKMLVFDIKKDFIHLPQLFPEVWKFKLPGAGFKWNLLQPAIRNWKRWAGILAQTIANSLGFFAGQSTEAFIYKTLLQLYSRYDMNNEAYPSLLDLYDFLQMKKVNKEFARGTEEYRSFERFLNRVETLVFSFEEVVDCSKGFELAKILDHHTVFDIAELKEDCQTVFTELFLTQILGYRLEKKERGGILRNVAVLDDAKRLMPAYREDQQSAIANMSRIIAFSREFGVGFIVAECDPALLAHSAKAACYTRLCFNLTDGKDIAAAVSSLKLDPEQAAEIQRLRIGEAVVRMSGRIDRPFVIQVTR